MTITEELDRALEREPGAPVFLVDVRGNTTHIVLPIDDARRMFDEFLRRELQEGFEQADRGELVDWDAERIKASGRDVLKGRSEAS